MSSSVVGKLTVVQSYKFTNGIYFAILSLFFSNLCKLANTAHLKHSLSSFLGLIIAFLLAKNLGVGIYELACKGSY